MLLGARREAAPEARVAITLVQAVLKSDKMDDVVRDAVMIGVAAIQPIIAARSEVTRASIERGRRRERWERIAVSSAKQCGRAVVPVILEPEPFDAVATLVDERQLPGPALMLVEPRQEPTSRRWESSSERRPGRPACWSGPREGGRRLRLSSASERCRLVTLGGRTIRGDAMALVAMAALFAKWGEY